MDIKLLIDEEAIKNFAKQEIKRIIQSSEGSWWDMKRLEAETCRKRDWLLANILLNPSFKQEMKLVSNGGEGGRWMFKAHGMRQFLDQNFEVLNCTPSKLAR
ncbi:DUF771 domain-containing protein [Paenibacillus odorifer]|uniref:DUF771 domain-containing protein n=1 Tax=Paenibacillus TaxID=44249 RepID=UPI00097B0710|nr:DUF771 domain-containing protein [Paenibacillus odorifer]OMC95949.1 hypothetical protein BJP46_28425 [Paenibacillus odorifer]